MSEVQRDLAQASHEGAFGCGTISEVRAVRVGRRAGAGRTAAGGHCVADGPAPPAAGSVDWTSGCGEAGRAYGCPFRQRGAAGDGEAWRSDAQRLLYRVR